MRWLGILLLLVCGCSDNKARCAEARKQARAALEELSKKLPADDASRAETVAEYDQKPDEGPSFMAPLSDDANELRFQFHPRLPAKASDVKEGSREYLRYVELGVKAREVCKK